jgi:hypothetical protein
MVMAMNHRWTLLKGFKQTINHSLLSLRSVVRLEQPLSSNIPPHFPVRLAHLAFILSWLQTGRQSLLSWSINPQILFHQILKFIPVFWFWRFYFLPGSA